MRVGLARPSCACLLAVHLLGCSDVGQRQAELPLFVAGSELSQPIAAAGGVQISVESARLAFGPLYLCSGLQAGELCETARLEWLDSAIIDLTDPTPRPAGALTGATGTVRSWMYDLGISSQLSRDEPFVSGAAQRLGNVSLALEGRASGGGSELRFRADVVVQQGSETEQGVPVVRKATSDRFAHDVTGDERGLWLRFDAEPWIGGIDLRPQLEAAAACAAPEACATPLRLEADSQAYLSLHNAMISGNRAEFSWQPFP